MNKIEKELARAVGLDRIAQGDSISVPVDLLLIHDGSAAAFMDVLPDEFTPALKGENVVVTIDHAIPAPTVEARALHRRIKNFCRKYGLTHYGNGEGIMHQVVAEKHPPQPGQIIVGADGHVLTSTAFDAICFSETGKKAAEILLSGEYELIVPETVTVAFDGEISSGVTPRDLAFTLAEELGVNDCAGRFLQIYAPQIHALSISSKMTFCNILGELGIKSCCFIDDTDLKQDSFVRHISISTGEPLAAVPGSPDKICKVRELSEIKPSLVVIGGCSNGRIEDMAAVSRIVEKRTIHPDIELVILPASRNVANQMDKEGYSEVIRDAGGVIAPPGCGSCGGAHQGLAGVDDVVVTTTVRNTPGRMGAQEAQIYLVSPETAAQTSISGYIDNQHSR